MKKMKKDIIPIIEKLIDNNNISVDYIKESCKLCGGVNYNIHIILHEPIKLINIFGLGYMNIKLKDFKVNINICLRCGHIIIYRK